MCADFVVEGYLRYGGGAPVFELPCARVSVSYVALPRSRVFHESDCRLAVDVVDVVLCLSVDGDGEPVQWMEVGEGVVEGVVPFRPMVVPRCAVCAAPAVRGGTVYMGGGFDYPTCGDVGHAAAIVAWADHALAVDGGWAGADHGCPLSVPPGWWPVDGDGAVPVSVAVAAAARWAGDAEGIARAAFPEDYVPGVGA